MKTETESATESYAKQRGDVARLLDVLDMELAAHAERAASDPANWCKVGDLCRARLALINAVSVLSGKSVEDIRDFLYERGAE